jgi:pilus assembly protein Flp/PilA
MKRLRGFLSEQDGSTAVEYGLLAGIVAVALIVGVGAIAGGLENVMTIISDSLVIP